MTIRYNLPPGIEPPEAWQNMDRIPVDEFNTWWQQAQKGIVRATKRTGKRNCNQGRREDLGHRCRSSMEANWERYLRFLGYQQWTSKEEDPPVEGKWYRYEGNRWDFPQKTKNGKYIPDYEVWPGLFDTSLPYEVHEVKGWMDGDSKTKLNRMGKYYPEVPLVVVTKAVMKRHTKGCKHLIPHWE